MSDLLPTPRELFNQATTDLIRQYEQRNPDGEFGLVPKALEAYVEYHLACPEAQRDYRRPDPEAVERAYRALRSKFRDADETARWIVKTAKAIEHIYYFDGGG